MWLDILVDATIIPIRIPLLAMKCKDAATPRLSCYCSCTAAGIKNLVTRFQLLT